MNQLLDKLFSVSKSKGMDFSLDRFKKACSLYGDPQNTFKSIHVAGTNGKGSVTLKIAKCLELSGFLVGLYTSPHISTFRERIQVNSLMIEEEFAYKYLKEILERCPELTFFEVMTLLGFLYFRLKKVDYAVIEVGLGGRLDATNIIDPILSVITSIGLDHKAILGQTKEVIAKEKAGIIKKNIPVVLGSQCQGFDCFYDIAKEKSAKIILAEPAKSSFYDDENSQTAIAVLKELSITSLEGLKARPKCRFEVINDIVLDVAHNLDGFERAFDAFKLKNPNKDIHLLLGMSQDKEIEDCLLVASLYVHSICFVPCSTQRGALPKSLLDIWMRISNKEAYAFDSIQEAFAKKPINMAMGSFYIMDNLRRYLGVVEPTDSIVVCESGQPLVQVGG
jgi:dihydrofolate synthase/folylpolyglutamate synthase